MKNDHTKQKNVLIACLFFLLNLGAFSSVEAVTLTYATYRSPSDIFADPWLNAWGKELEERSGGKLKMKVYWAGALGPGRDQFVMVKNGVVDMTDFAGSWMPGKFTMSEVANLPFAANDPNNIVTAMNKMAKMGYFEKQWGEVELLTFSATPPYIIVFRKDKPMTVQELSGLKARTPGGYTSKYLHMLGMIPVNLKPADAYLAWQTGVVDAWINPVAVLTKYKFFELPIKAILDVNLQNFGNAAVIMNKHKFNSLSPDLQNLIKETAIKYIHIYVDLGIEADMEAKKEAKNYGIEYYRMSPAEMEKIWSIGRSLWEEFISDMESQNLPGKKVVEDYSEILRDLGENPPY